MSETEKMSFLGIPVTGERQGDNSILQRQLEDLEPYLRAVLEDEEIVEFGWDQYTPYFNDGEPCVFGVNEPWYRTTSCVDGGEHEDADKYELTADCHPDFSGKTWNRELKRWDTVSMTAAQAARFERCRALSWELESGHYHSVLLDAFGDHAEVTVRRTGITINRYSHD